MKKDKLSKDLKIYNIIMSCIWKLIAFFLLGVLGGYLLKRYGKDEDINYMLISVLTFSIIGIIDFFISIIRESKKIKKIKESDKENNDIDALK